MIVGEIRLACMLCILVSNTTFLSFVSWSFMWPFLSGRKSSSAAQKRQLHEDVYVDLEQGNEGSSCVA